MRAKTAYWFEVTVCYLKQMEDGTEKKANEIYTTDAMSFGEAESRALKELKTRVVVESKSRISILHPIKKYSLAMMKMMTNGSK